MSIAIRRVGGFWFMQILEGKYFDAVKVLCSICLYTPIYQPLEMLLAFLVVAGYRTGIASVLCQSTVLMFF